MTESSFVSPFGVVEIERLPRRKRELLRAWDAADEYLLKTVVDESLVADSALICNDNFGALSVALHTFHPVSWSDSLTAHKATQLNLRKNGFDEVELSRTGTIWSYTNACYKPPAPFVAADPHVPYAIAAGQLEKEQMVGHYLSFIMVVLSGKLVQYLLRKGN